MNRAEQLRHALIRSVPTLPLERQERAPHYDSQGVRVSSGMAAHKLGVSYDVLASGKRACPYHYHVAQEELFVVLQGRGTLRVAGELLAIGAGDVITIPPGRDYPHQLINTSDAPLAYLSISTQETPEICYYPDSGKYLAKAGDVRVITRGDATVDYWDGEP